MMVVRLVALGVLAYVAWLLLRGLLGQAGVDRSGAGKEKDPKVHDVLVEDPVCHTLVPKNQAIRLRQDGKTYYFCSEACCDKFVHATKGEQ